MFAHCIEVHDVRGKHSRAAENKSCQDSAKELAVAHAALVGASSDYSDTKKGMGFAVGLFQDVDALRATVIAVEAELRDVEAFLISAEQAVRDAKAGETASPEQAELKRTHTRREQVRKRYDRERLSLAKAEKLRSLTAKVEEYTEKVRVAELAHAPLQQVFDANRQYLRDVDAHAHELPKSPILVIDAEEGIRQAPTLAHAAEFLHTERAFRVIVAEDQSEVLVPAAAVLEGFSHAAASAAASSAPVALLALDVVPAYRIGCSVIFTQFTLCRCVLTDRVLSKRKHVFLKADAQELSDLHDQVNAPADKISGAELMRAWLQRSPAVALSDEVTEAMYRVLDDKTLPAPPGLDAELRPYQLSGFRWLATNAASAMGSILADDMGLGKTMQAIAFLLHLRARGLLDLPALLVMPLSVLSNWASELSRFAPSLRQRIYHDAGRSLEHEKDDVDVILTTYAVVQRDVDVFCSCRRFAAVILDEGQTIKNAGSLTAQAVKRVADEAASGVRVVLSGTPVENRLGELWSLMDFAVPGLFRDQKSFEADFSRPLERLAPGRLREKVHTKLMTAITPFVLRRLKTDEEVAKDLPQKIPIVHKVDLTDAQRQLYAAIEEECMAIVRSPAAVPAADANVCDADFDMDTVTGEASENCEAREPDKKRRKRRAPSPPQSDIIARVEAPSGHGARATRVFALLHGLQMAVNHPAAVTDARWPAALDRSSKSFGPAVGNSGKLARLLEFLEEILALGDKVLVFTQYLQTLKLLVDSLQVAHPNLKVLQLHGQCSRGARDEAVHQFQSNLTCAVLVCSLAAGGVGINLTAASHVVHFDRCWNPAKESQATDRAHRIGQTKTVMVHRFVSVGTFEERLDKAHAWKMALAGEVIPDGTPSAITSMSLDELHDVFSLTSD